MTCRPHVNTQGCDGDAWLKNIEVYQDIVERVMIDRNI